MKITRVATPAPWLILWVFASLDSASRLAVKSMTLRRVWLSVWSITKNTRCQRGSGWPLAQVRCQMALPKFMQRATAGEPQRPPCSVNPNNNAMFLIGLDARWSLYFETDGSMSTLMTSAVVCPRLATNADNFWRHGDIRMRPSLLLPDLLTQTACLGAQHCIFRVGYCWTLLCMRTTIIVMPGMLDDRHYTSVCSRPAGCVPLSTHGRHSGPHLQALWLPS